MGYRSGEEARHVHKVSRFALIGVRKVQVCLPNDSSLRTDLDRFKHVWDQSVNLLRQRGLERLSQGIYIVFTERRGFYARFWKDNILVVNLRDFLAQGSRAPGILLHELGHRVWFRVATVKTRARWAADHHQRLRMSSHGDSFVSSYAKRNALEDHAEAFRCRVEGGLKGHALTRYERMGPLTRTIRKRLRAA